MSVDKNDDKVIIRRENLPGIDKSIFDHSYAFSTPIAWAKVTIDSYKKGAISYVGLDQNLNVGDIIQPTNTNSTYKVVKFQKIVKKDRIYKIVRTDGYPLVALDLDKLVKGRKLKIKNRAGIRERFNERIDQWRV